MSNKNRKNQQNAPQQVQQAQQHITPYAMWKTVITVVTGVTAIIILLITINAIIQPYYEMQAAITALTTHLQEEKKERQVNEKKVTTIEGDIAVMSKALHLLLLSYTNGDINKQELEDALALFEATIIYGVSQKTTTDAQDAIGEITRKTLEELAKLSN